MTVKPHVFRRMAASLLDAQLDAKTAAAQLGHSTEATTLRHYADLAHIAPDSRVAWICWSTNPTAMRPKRTSWDSDGSGNGKGPQPANMQVRGRIVQSETR